MECSSDEKQMSGCAAKVTVPCSLVMLVINDDSK